MPGISDEPKTNSIICKDCGTRNKPRARFCGKCGKPFPEFALKQVVLENPIVDVDPTAETQPFEVETAPDQSEPTSSPEEANGNGSAPSVPEPSEPSTSSPSPTTPPDVSGPEVVSLQSSPATMTKEQMKKALENLSRRPRTSSTTSRLLYQLENRS
jgi:hypothetical protein